MPRLRVGKRTFCPMASFASGCSTSGYWTPGRRQSPRRRDRGNMRKHEIPAAIEKARTKRAEALRIDDLRRRVSGSPRCGAAGSRYRSRASVSLGFIHAGSPPSWDLFWSNFSQLRKNHDGVLIAERANGSQLIEIPGTWLPGCHRREVPL
jgi:hypothetical protein